MESREELNYYYKQLFGNVAVHLYKRYNKGEQMATVKKITNLFLQSAMPQEIEDDLVEIVQRAKKASISTEELQSLKSFFTKQEIKNYALEHLKTELYFSNNPQITRRKPRLRLPLTKEGCVNRLQEVAVGLYNEQYDLNFAKSEETAVRIKSWEETRTLKAKAAKKIQALQTVKELFSQSAMPEEIVKYLNETAAPGQKLTEEHIQWLKNTFANKNITNQILQSLELKLAAAMQAKAKETIEQKAETKAKQAKQIAEKGQEIDSKHTAEATLNQQAEPTLNQKAEPTLNQKAEAKAKQAKQIAEKGQEIDSKHTAAIAKAEAAKHKAKEKKKIEKILGKMEDLNIQEDIAEDNDLTESNIKDAEWARQKKQTANLHRGADNARKALGNLIEANLKAKMPIDPALLQQLKHFKDEIIVDEDEDLEDKSLENEEIKQESPEDKQQDINQKIKDGKITLENIELMITEEKDDERKNILKREIGALIQQDLKSGKAPLEHNKLIALLKLSHSATEKKKVDKNLKSFAEEKKQENNR